MRHGGVRQLHDRTIHHGAAASLRRQPEQVPVACRERAVQELEDTPASRYSAEPRRHPPVRERCSADDAPQVLKAYRQSPALEPVQPPPGGVCAEAPCGVERAGYLRAGERARHW
jgi:hypothetical protein